MVRLAYGSWASILFFLIEDDARLPPPQAQSSTERAHHYEPTFHVDVLSALQQLHDNSITEDEIVLLSQIVQRPDVQRRMIDPRVRSPSSMEGTPNAQIVSSDAPANHPVGYERSLSIVRTGSDRAANSRFPRRQSVYPFPSGQRDDLSEVDLQTVRVDGTSHPSVRIKSN